MQLCHTDNRIDSQIKLEQRADGLFRVTYGQQVNDNLEYAAACQAYGEVVFHALSCVGKLDNGY